MTPRTYLNKRPEEYLRKFLDARYILTHIFTETFPWDVSQARDSEQEFIRLSGIWILIRHACNLSIPSLKQMAPNILNSSPLGSNTPLLSEALNSKCAVVHVPLSGLQGHAPTLARRYRIGTQCYWESNINPIGESYTLADAILRYLTDTVLSPDDCKAAFASWIFTGDARANRIHRVTIDNKIQLVDIYPELQWMIPHENMADFKGVLKVLPVTQLESAFNEIGNVSARQEVLIRSIRSNNDDAVLLSADVLDREWDSSNFRRLIEALQDCTSDNIKKLLAQKDIYDRLLISRFSDALQKKLIPFLKEKKETSFSIFFRNLTVFFPFEGEHASKPKKDYTMDTTLTINRDTFFLLLRQAMCQPGSELFEELFRLCGNNAEFHDSEGNSIWMLWHHIVARHGIKTPHPIDTLLRTYHADDENFLRVLYLRGGVDILCAIASSSDIAINARSKDGYRILDEITFKECGDAKLPLCTPEDVKRLREAGYRFGYTRDGWDPIWCRADTPQKPPYWDECIADARELGLTDTTQTTCCTIEIDIDDSCCDLKKCVGFRYKEVPLKETSAGGYPEAAELPKQMPWENVSYFYNAWDTEISMSDELSLAQLATRYQNNSTETANQH